MHNLLFRVFQCRSELKKAAVIKDKAAKRKRAPAKTKKLPTPKVKPAKNLENAIKRLGLVAKQNKNNVLPSPSYSDDEEEDGSEYEEF